MLVLVLTNMLGGVGVASGIAVSSLLVVSFGGAGMAGFAQALGVLGAALCAVPLANLAHRFGRRRALTLGYAIAFAGASTVLTGAKLGLLPVILVGLVAFGAAQATNLQSRYAAAGLASPERRGRVLSLVVWATTIGQVLGPNLSQAGAALGRRLGMPELAGPYVFSLAGFVLAATVVLLGYPRSLDTAARPTAPHESSAANAAAAPTPRRTGAWAALRWALAHPVARLGVLLLAGAHAVMVGVMSMTPLHLTEHHGTLTVVGFVLSMHILGMYALSPVFGWLADRWGGLRTAALGLGVLAASVALAAWGAGDVNVVTIALLLLGVGWSASTIAASTVLASVDAGDARVPLQGATDALMSYGGAASALVSGPIMAGLGYGGLALIAGGLLVPLLVTLVAAWRAQAVAAARV